ncbi:FKBP-type peptidyl-prolyl cis-trans isomerase [Parahalioglobus pacificus]|uniref:Peptidyl-prolyl cis-trans isomerase n=1 Tax=Parahalioglobus pacificus TaxID=930806 RepID=A0A918XKS8_9GAMM|nr:FKBP-type peptidyl-prolyl cis-trans isomerase [Halioglobus pacificus]GHD36553.1 peptidyl-prolyl cis-trans isomerase [Halioglobus pacificus]
MKKLALPAVIAAMLVGLQGCSQDSGSGADAEVALDTPTKRLSYGFAYRMGQRMVTDGMDLDADAYSAGMRDAMAGTDSRLTDEEINAEMVAFQERMEAEQQANATALAEANAAAAAEFLAANAQREGVIVTESGLQYEVVEAGEGALPGAEDTVEVHYRGTLIDGTEFDSSYGRGQTVTFGVGQVIAGWTEALQLMPAGSKWKLYIPSELAYGSGGAGQLIGPNAALVFDVELIAIPSQAAAEEGASDEAAAEASEG